MSYRMTFDKSTKFVTDQGIKSFFDFEPGDTVNVYNRYGELEEGTIVEKQNETTRKNINTFNIGGDETLKPNGQLPQSMFLTKKEIITYGEDLWLSYNNDYYENLRFGDALAVAPKNLNNVLIDLKSPEWFINGMIFANGEDYIRYYTNSYGNNLAKLSEGNYIVMTEDVYNENKVLLDQLKLYGEKFKYIETTIPIKANPEDYVIFIKGEQRRKTILKLNGWNKCPDYYKGDAFEGYLYFKNRETLEDRRFIIRENDKFAIKFIEDCSKFAGYHITNINEVIIPSHVLSNFYKAKEHDHTEKDIINTNMRIYKKQLNYWEILLDPKYKRTNQRKYKFVSRETEITRNMKSYIIDTESGSFILANGIIALSKPFNYIVR